MLNCYVLDLCSDVQSGHIYSGRIGKRRHDPLSITLRIYDISSNKLTDPEKDMSNPSNKPVNYQS